MDINMQIGKELRRYRKKRNMTLEEAAKQMNMSHQSLFKYEQGETKISSETLFKLSKIYNVAVENFFADVKDPKDVLKLEHISNQSMTRPLKIMLVEDDIIDAEAFQKCVGEINDRVILHVYNSPDLAENYLRNTPQDLPDLILLDLNLPNQSGFQLLKRLKNHRSFLHIPVIIWTGSLSYADLNKSYEYGACAYVCKCYDVEELLAKTKKLIDFWQDVALFKEIPKAAAT